jgi:quinol monooxygenase YgiN
MYIRVTRGRFDPAKYDEFSRLSQEVNLAVQRLPGCRSLHSGGDRAAGRLIAVSTWDSEEQARFSRDALGDVIARLQSLGGQLEPPEIYESLT